MKYMKLGTRPDTFFTSESVRSVCTEVATDLQILVDGCVYHLHKVIDSRSRDYFLPFFFIFIYA